MIHWVWAVAAVIPAVIAAWYIGFLMATAAMRKHGCKGCLIAERAFDAMQDVKGKEGSE